MNTTTGVQKAVVALGSQVALAKALGVSAAAVQLWVRDGIVPPRRVLSVEKASGVSRHELNPELYPVESTAA